MKKILAWIYAGAIFVLIYLPIAVMAAMSFNRSRYNALPFEFSLHWYRELSANRELFAGTRYSILLAAAAAVICMVLGTLLVYGISRSSRRLKNRIQTLSILPLTIPWIILGISLLLFIRFLGFNRNFFFLLMGHVVVTIPYFILVLNARIESLDLSLEDASYTLGANALKTFWRVSLPTLLPAILAGAFLAFLVSFNMFVLSYFLIETGSSTLPIEIYTSIKFGFTPEINGISTLILAVSTLLFIAVAVLTRHTLKQLME
ncbi:MAG: ABC transporter permease [Spirochaetaceae bacterium]